MPLYVWCMFSALLPHIQTAIQYRVSLATFFLCAGLLYPWGPPREGSSSIWRSWVPSDQLRQVQHPPLPLLLWLRLQTSCRRHTDQDGPPRETNEGESSLISLSDVSSCYSMAKITSFSDTCSLKCSRECYAVILLQIKKNGINSNFQSIIITSQTTSATKINNFLMEIIIICI